MGCSRCAPNIRPGAARIFDVNDIITLRGYSRLTNEDQMDAKVAGPLACGLRELLHVPGS